MRSLPCLLAAALLVLPACGSDAPEPAPTPSATPEPGAEAKPKAKTGRKGKRKKKDRPDDAGWWRRFRTHRLDPNLTDEQRAELEALEAIGYVTGSVEGPGGGTGVVRNDGDRVFGALNFYTSGHAPEAILMDNAGAVLHRWSKPFKELWPDYPIGKNHNSRHCWRRAKLLPNGEVIAIFGGLGMVKLDKDSDVLWAHPNRAHHDLDIAPDGTVYVLTRQAHKVPRVNTRKPILEDYLVILDADGTERQTISVLEAFERSPDYRWIFDKKTTKRGDLFHTNSVFWLDGSLASKLPAFKRGNVLVSCRANNTLAVIDPATGTVVWAHEGGTKRDFLRQHDPTILADGTLMVFDNRDSNRSSAVETYDPVTMRKTWSYAGTDTDPFYSETCGAAERLPNGNTLVTESDNGRAFEVTADGTIVWEFLNPNRAGPEGEYIAALFEVARFDASFDTSWIDGAE